MDIRELYLLPSMFCSLWLAILFLQSGIDKVINRARNLSYLTEHFGRSPLKSWVPQLLTLLTVLEVFSGLFSALGVVYIPFGDLRPALFGSILSMATLLTLFFGQRMAQDYAGAANLVPYGLFALASFLVIYLTPALGKYS